NDQSLTVDSLLVTGSAAHLSMTNASGHLTVNHGAVFNGADHNGWLQNGTLELKGNFTQQNVYTGQSFYPTLSHATVFSGTGTQTVSFATPGPATGNTSYFNHLSIATAVAITSSTTVYVGGTFGSVTSSDLSGVGNLVLFGSIPFPTVAG